MEQIIYSPKALGSAIKRQRKAKKLSQTLAGNTFKIDQSTLSSVEQGAPGTRIETLFRILAALELEMLIRPKKNSVRKILGHPDSMNPNMPRSHNQNLKSTSKNESANRTLGNTSKKESASDSPDDEQW